MIIKIILYFYFIIGLIDLGNFIIKFIIIYSYDYISIPITYSFLYKIYFISLLI